jgi:hypothetical protein
MGRRYRSSGLTRQTIPLARSRQSSVGGIRATSTSVECLRVCCEPDSRRKVARRHDLEELLIEAVPQPIRGYSLSRTVGLEPQKTASSISSATNSPATRPADEACVIFSNARPPS